jgi:hypothetical protein
MIVVVGTPAWRPTEPAAPAGLACGIALAAAAHGAAVELVGRTGDDPAGDALLIALAHAGVGHVALLRDPARPTPLVEPEAEAEEVDLLADEADDADVADDVSPTVAGPRLEAPDVDLGLRYLTAFAVIVVTDDALDAALAVATEAAAFASAHLVVLVREGSDLPPDIPATATVLAAPRSDPDGAFAASVGSYAAGLDAGRTPDEAFRAALAAGWEPSVA